MTPRRPRIAHDHKAPLIACVLIVVVSLGVLVHMARSEAAPGWMRQGVSTVLAGGAPLTRHVVEHTPLATERSGVPRAEEAPVLPAAPTTEATGTSAAPDPDATGGGHDPEPGPEPGPRATDDGRTPPVLQPGPQTPTPSTPNVPTAPDEPAVPTAPTTPTWPTTPATGGKGPGGHGVATGHQSGGGGGPSGGGQPEPGPIRGSAAEHAHGHPWYDEDWMKGPGRGKDHQRGPGHGQGPARR